ncbi:hypothetical protein VZ94_11960 [Methylocucumis oryzae]|uniref:Uncharacterized protein n=1 Tax=Methylocucumis oryzae TaxID=1632867 RepID=A0A0F3IIG0_9GAMM|nr:hypothetical protein VZ94_11960 [Methylocucumis oryzae]
MRPELALLVTGLTRFYPHEFFLTCLKMPVSATSKQKPLQTQKAAIAATLEQAKLAYGLHEVATTRFNRA